MQVAYFYANFCPDISIPVSWDFLSKSWTFNLVSGDISLYLRILELSLLGFFLKDLELTKDLELLQAIRVFDTHLIVVGKLLEKNWYKVQMRRVYLDL